MPKFVKRFGFHNLGRHSLATLLVEEQENPAVVQTIMCHAKMDMTLLYCSHSRRKACRAREGFKRAPSRKNTGANAGAGGNSVERRRTENLCIMRNLPHPVGA